jgi:hypothetical protein
MKVSLLDSGGIVRSTLQSSVKLASTGPGVQLTAMLTGVELLQPWVYSVGLTDTEIVPVWLNSAQDTCTASVGTQLPGIWGVAVSSAQVVPAAQPVVPRLIGEGAKVMVGEAAEATIATSRSNDPNDLAVTVASDAEVHLEPMDRLPSRAVDRGLEAAAFAVPSMPRDGY